MAAHETPEGADGQIPDGVLAIAARLFSELGYDAVTTQFIADACGIDAAVVTDVYGGKANVFLAVMERLTRERMEYLSPALAAFTPDAEGVIRLIDRYLDYSLEHPELPSIWMHRWMSDASDFPDMELRYGARPAGSLIQLIGQALDEDVDPELFTWHLIWAIRGFTKGGVLGADGVRRRSEDTEIQRRFRDSLHLLVRRVATR
ncbi:TetR/AcrR family transcriptional regulator [Actinomadura roseirufa]|uniref:TetR/AcrR family transcriptional regulator n=1 Tax=Actinomadura roseirufa TaxID=2094049 RepID=UPI0010413622|nr:TetR/AcrR family transcriptional regulator [Actinomadura roseirufa]